MEKQEWISKEFQNEVLSSIRKCHVNTQYIDLPNEISTFSSSSSAQPIKKKRKISKSNSEAKLLQNSTKTINNQVIISVDPLKESSLSYPLSFPSSPILQPKSPNLLVLETEQPTNYIFFSFS
jgi:hypothetical protein